MANAAEINSARTLTGDRYVDFSNKAVIRVMVDPASMQIPPSARMREKMEIVKGKGKRAIKKTVSIPRKFYIEAILPAVFVEQLRQARGKKEVAELVKGFAFDLGFAKEAIYKSTQKALYSKLSPAEVTLYSQGEGTLGWPSIPALIGKFPPQVGIFQSGEPNYTVMESMLREIRLWINRRKTELMVEACMQDLPARLADHFIPARSIRRRLKLVLGPTNSGKTRQALDRLVVATSGTYLGPLRLLALEVRDTLEERGVPTSLVTGELIEERKGSLISSRTIEMTDFSCPVEVAVIDEVQMLEDPQRGWAWTHAILGVPANEVWLLGSPEAEQAVMRLAEYLGEPLEIIRTERMTELEVAQAPASLASLPKCSAVVAFSRNDVIALAGELKEEHKRSVSILYGALSPEVRRQQAQMFRDGETDIVVSTDVLAMGLNLPVETMVFTTTDKWNGAAQYPIDQHLAWQIAGRAGRYGLHEKGIVTAINREELAKVQRLLMTRPKPIRSIFQFAPALSIMLRISHHLSTTSVAKCLRFFQDAMRADKSGLFTPVRDMATLAVAEYLDSIGMDFKDSIALLGAPFPTHMREIDRVALEMLDAIISGRRLAHNHSKQTSLEHCYNQEAAERAVKLLNLYCWLHYRFPETYPQYHEARETIGALDVIIIKHLAAIRQKRCLQCRGRLPAQHKYKICNGCYAENHSLDDCYNC